MLHHKAMCEKRVAELHDAILFKQPESSHLGDCPICYLPLSLDTSKNRLKLCCSKMICEGCLFANMIRARETKLDPTCIFCRQPDLKTRAEADTDEMRRVEANDPIAL